ncbi:SCO3374 family protein [Streptomyces olivoverticillatus]|uniref:SCO3374 family protein n=1 Tax=Streptomyces olivoverticillatus TaxID=66427 RepID=UPI001C884206
MTVAPPHPCRPLDEPRPPRDHRLRRRRRQWYECVLGWPTAPVTGEGPLELLTGVRFDALGMPAAVGFSVLGRLPATGPVALDVPARKMWFLTAAGSADELPELLAWLEWGDIALDLEPLGQGGRIVAPVPVSPPGIRWREAVEAVWVRPPDPGREVEPTLPATGLGGDGGAPDLVRLVSAAATECHRARLLRAGVARRDQPPGDRPRGPEDQALAFSYASRMSAGTRPRSLTL